MNGPFKRARWAALTVGFVGSLAAAIYGAFFFDGPAQPDATAHMLLSVGGGGIGSWLVLEVHARFQR